MRKLASLRAILATVTLAVTMLALLVALLRET